MFGKIMLGFLYTITPIWGWIALARSIKRVNPGEITMLKTLSGKVELIDKEGIYFRPNIGDTFSKSYNKTDAYIDFGPLKRVCIKNEQIACKRKADGSIEILGPGIHIIDSSKNETFNQEDIKNKTDNYIDFGSKKIVRILPGQLGIKTDKNGNYIELAPGIHEIDVANNETFDSKIGIQSIGQEDFTLGNHRYVTIRDGEFGESYDNGTFVLLKPGQHKLPAHHIFKKKVATNTNFVDLGALQIVTVNEGQVAVVNTPEGVVTKGPGKHTVNQTEGNFLISVINTNAQTIEVPPLTVMCSDQIEMNAESVLTYKIQDPLKAIGTGLNKIIDYLKKIADGTLRTILSRFSSSDVAPSFHTDERDNKRPERLKALHDECVEELHGKAQEWGIEVTDLQITKILPPEGEYLNTIRRVGTQNATAEADRRLAENKAQIAKINAQAEEARVTAAEMEQREAVVRAQTEAKTKEIQAKNEAKLVLTKATAQAQTVVVAAKADALAITTRATAEAGRIKQLNKATKGAPKITQEIMKLEAQGKIIEKVPNPVFIQPSLGNTSILNRNANGATFFSNNPQRSVDAIALAQQPGVTPPATVITAAGMPQP